MNARISGRDATLIIAVAIAGMIAGSVVNTLFWVTTPILVIVLIASSQDDAVRPDDVLFGGLPEPLRDLVSSTRAQLHEGQPRQLLDAVIQPARAILGATHSEFGAARDDEMHGHVADLLTDSCEIALDLAQLHASLPASLANADLAQRHQTATDLMVKSLRDAAWALAALHAAGIEHGTPASERVADLVVELRAEASARSAAKAELSELLQTKG